MPKYNANKIEKNIRITNIVEIILYFNKENQKGYGLKIQTTDQPLSRLPITLAQVNTAINSEIKLKWNQTIIVFFVEIIKTYKTNL